MADGGGPFGSTVQGTRELVRDVGGEGARLSAGVGRGPRQVGDEQLVRWLDEGGSRVASRVFGYERILATPLATHVTVEARALTQLYAAALLWDVTHPERTGQKGTLGDALMVRFTDGLADLQAWYEVERAIAEARGVDDPDLPPEQDGVGAAYRFPSRRSPGRMSRYTRF